MIEDLDLITEKRQTEEKKLAMSHLRFVQNRSRIYSSSSGRPNRDIKGQEEEYHRVKVERGSTSSAGYGKSSRSRVQLFTISGDNKGISSGGSGDINGNPKLDMREYLRMILQAKGLLSKKQVCFMNV